MEDTRDHGCGYDFRIQPTDRTVITIEIKGLSSKNSGILLTSKKWETAKIMGKDYFLALVSGMDDRAIIEVT